MRSPGIVEAVQPIRKPRCRASEANTAAMWRLPRWMPPAAFSSVNRPMNITPSPDERHQRLASASLYHEPRTPGRYLRRLARPCSRQPSRGTAREPRPGRSAAAPARARLRERKAIQSRTTSPVTPGSTRSGQQPTASDTTPGRPVVERLVHDQSPGLRAEARQDQEIRGVVERAELGLSAEADEVSAHRQAPSEALEYPSSSPSPRNAKPGDRGAPATSPLPREPGSPALSAGSASPRRAGGSSPARGRAAVA